MRPFPLRPELSADRLRAVRQASRPIEPAVADELEAQSARHAPSAARDRNLALLRQGAAAVVTGQQVGLFLGPLYTLYKAASAVRIARALSEESGAPVVPVFWLQTEDHDLPEVATCTIVTPSGQLRTLQLSADEGRISMAHRRLPEEVASHLDAMRDELGELPFGEAHLDWLASHYQPGASWAGAFGAAIAELFADDGLIVVDPRTPALAAAGREVHRHALEARGPIAAALLDRCAALRRADQPVPVHVREGAPLSFFHPEGPGGPRHRLDAELAEIGGEGRHAERDLLARLEEEPLSFSTSALLRPILQDTLLPTAAYVGGPGELAYLAQVEPLYAAFDMQMPLVIHRARFVVVEPRARRLLRRLGLEIEEVQAAEEALLQRLARADLPDPDELAESLLQPLLGRIEEVAAPLRGHLERSLRRTRSSLQVAVRRFARRYEAARLRHDGGLVEDVRKLHRLLHPAGGPQERLHGLPPYGARYGERAFMEALRQAVRPWDSTLRVLEP